MYARTIHDLRDTLLLFPVFYRRFNMLPLREVQTRQLFQDMLAWVAIHPPPFSRALFPRRPTPMDVSSMCDCLIWHWSSSDSSSSHFSSGFKGEKPVKPFPHPVPVLTLFLSHSLSMALVVIRGGRRKPERGTRLRCL